MQGQVVTTIVGLVAGGLLIPALQWLKRRTGIRGLFMQWIAYFSVLAVTLVVALLLGVAGVEAFTPANLLHGGAVSFLVNQVGYTVYKTVLKALGESS